MSEDQMTATVVCTNVIGMGEGKPFKGSTDHRGRLLQRRVVTDRTSGRTEPWRIEETFKVTSAETRYVSSANTLAHFLILLRRPLLMRLLEYRMDWKHSAGYVEERLPLQRDPCRGPSCIMFDHYDGARRHRQELDFSSRRSRRRYGT